MSKYKEYGHLAKAVYFETGNVQETARQTGLSASTITTWVRKHGWRQQYTSSQAAPVSPLETFQRRLQRLLDETEDNTADRLPEIKELSGLVLDWQRYRDQAAAAARKEQRETQPSVDKAALFLEHVRYITEVYLRTATAEDQIRWAETVRVATEEYKAQ
jgi:hypothetical protein